MFTVCFLRISYLCPLLVSLFVFTFFQIGGNIYILWISSLQSQLILPVYSLSYYSLHVATKVLCFNVKSILPIFLRLLDVVSCLSHPNILKVFFIFFYFFRDVIIFRSLIHLDFIWRMQDKSRHLFFSLTFFMIQSIFSPVI